MGVLGFCVTSCDGGSGTVLVVVVGSNWGGYGRLYRRKGLLEIETVCHVGAGTWAGKTRVGKYVT